MCIRDSIRALADQRVPFEIRPLASNSCPIPPSRIFVVLKKSVFITPTAYIETSIIGRINIKSYTSCSRFKK